MHSLPCSDNPFHPCNIERWRGGGAPQFLRVYKINMSHLHSYSSNLLPIPNTQDVVSNEDFRPVRWRGTDGLWRCRHQRGVFVCRLDQARPAITTSHRNVARQHNVEEASLLPTPRGHGWRGFRHSLLRGCWGGGGHPISILEVTHK